MKQLASIFANLFGGSSATPTDPEARRRWEIHREWDRQRARALTPADQAEIDAIFSRNL